MLKKYCIVFLRTKMFTILLCLFLLWILLASHYHYMESRNAILKSHYRYLENLNSIEIVQYLVQPKMMCKSQRGILFVVKSAIEEFKERNVIRKTWMPKALSLNMSIIFSVAISLNSSVNNLLMNEANKFGDILQASFLESYHRLALKTYFNMRWINQHCSGLGYVFVTVSDVIVFPHALLNLTMTMAPINNTILGYCWLSGSRPTRDKKFISYISEKVWPDSKYPPYCNGSGYLMTGDVPEKLLKAIPGGPDNWQWAYKMDHLEDVVFTGYLRQRANVNIKQVDQLIFNQVYRMHLHLLATTRVSENV